MENSLINQSTDKQTPSNQVLYSPLPTGPFDYECMSAAIQFDCIIHLHKTVQNEVKATILPEESKENIRGDSISLISPIVVCKEANRFRFIRPVKVYRFPRDARIIAIHVLNVKESTEIFASEYGSSCNIDIKVTVTFDVLLFLSALIFGKNMIFVWQSRDLEAHQFFQVPSTDDGDFMAKSQITVSGWFYR
ncbi:hypothetical protein H1S01_04345 [Heliobacterium chlorum]|uniref:Uncharacterized protein n=1 Tax=Heliobacterium chlorum TaxID=2698 RepID=A0ABR7T0V1_HELCL|nr:hypothetical protein [Heliobacterium chlorum]MBC9783742.1 hypothetical protein [Heliobacterium chlorum]